LKLKDPKGDKAFIAANCLLSAMKLLLIAIGVLILSGFSFSDPHKLTQDLRKEIRAELQKIVEKTPGAKLRKEWRAQRDVANSLLEKAQTAQASKYCPKEWDEAVALFKKAKYYASKRSYRKAIFLAKKSQEQAKFAYTTSKAKLLKQETGLKKQYKKLRSRLNDLAGAIPTDAEALAQKAATLSLELEDARLAMELLQFDEAKRELADVKGRMEHLEGLIQEYKKTHPLPDDDEET